MKPVWVIHIVCTHQTVSEQGVKRKCVICMYTVHIILNILLLHVNTEKITGLGMNFRSNYRRHVVHTKLKY